MEYVTYLNPVALQVQSMVARKARIIEDGPLCRRNDFVGFFDASRREMSICTSRIKAVSPWDYSRLINETLLHESVHVAQACKARAGYLKPLGIRRASMSLSSGRRADLRKALGYDSSLGHIEHEAYFMEDKPKLVLHVLNKYCF